MCFFKLCKLELYADILKDEMICNRRDKYMREEVINKILENVDK